VKFLEAIYCAGLNDFCLFNRAQAGILPVQLWLKKKAFASLQCVWAMLPYPNVKSCYVYFGVFDFFGLLESTGLCLFQVNNSFLHA
jgi:hypothetical protein